MCLCHFFSIRSYFKTLIGIFNVNTYKYIEKNKQIQIIFYHLYITGFTSSIIDKVFSFILVQTKIPYKNDFLLLVFMIGILPELLIMLLINCTRNINFSWFVKICLGLASLLFLGVGYFIGPYFLIVLGIYELNSLSIRQQIM